MESPALSITPDKTLEFETQSGSQTQVTLRLENPHDQNVAFKIKTTAPKSYLVKPSTGVILPKETQLVNILLIPHFDAKQSNSDRFLVQSTFVESSATLNRDAWATIPRSRLDERKLGVIINWANVPLKSTGAGSAAGASAGNVDQLVDSVSTFASKPIPDDYSSLKAHFDELMAVAISLERQNKELIAAANERGSASSSTGGKKPFGNGQIELWHIGIILITTIVALKFFRFI